MEQEPRAFPFPLATMLRAPHVVDGPDNILLRWIDLVFTPQGMLSAGRNRRQGPACAPCFGGWICHCL